LANDRRVKRTAVYVVILTAFVLTSGQSDAAPQDRVAFHYTYAKAVRLIRGEVALECGDKCGNYRLRRCHRTTDERARCELSAWLRHRTRPCRTGLSAWRRARAAEEGPFALPAERWIEFNVDAEESRCVVRIFPFGIPPSPPPPTA
jgi:hypothetical protein